MTLNNSFYRNNNYVEVFLVVDVNYRNMKNVKAGSNLRDYAVKQATDNGFERVLARVKADNKEANALLKNWKKEKKQGGATYFLEIDQNKRPGSETV